MAKLRVTRRMLRFVVVGVCNAAISFGLLNVCFYHFGIAKIPSSIIATSVALLFSFMLNRNFVFLGNDRRIRKQFLPFVLVTISGSLGILNLVYILFITILAHHDQWIVNSIHAVSGVALPRSFVDINLSTVLGAIAAMFWNYNGYRLFVFKTSPDKEVVDVETQKV